MSIRPETFQMAHVLLLILKIIYYICEEVYRFIIPTEKKSVAGEIVLITGAGHGIGKELAIGYASLGATVVCWDINEQPNNETMNEIKRMGKNSIYAYRCDVTDREEVFRVAEKVKKEVGDVTLLVNNAGITFVKTLMNYSPDEITQVLNVNLISNYWTMKAFLPSMIEKNYGHIVSVNTIAGLGDCYGTVYCTSKFAVRGLMEAMSEELRKLSNGKSSIKFTTVYPTFVKTGLTKSPKFRFSFMREFTSQETASSIIDAQRRNYTNISIPTYWLRSFKVLRLLPEEVWQNLKDVTDIIITPDENPED